MHARYARGQKGIKNIKRLRGFTYVCLVAAQETDIQVRVFISFSVSD